MGVRYQHVIHSLGRHVGKPLEARNVDIESRALADLVIQIFGDFNGAQTKQMRRFLRSTKLRGNHLVNRNIDAADTGTDLFRLFTAYVRHIALNSAILPPQRFLQQRAILSDGGLRVAHVEIEAALSQCAYQFDAFQFFGGVDQGCLRWRRGGNDLGRCRCARDERNTLLADPLPLTGGKRRQEMKLVIAFRFEHGGVAFWQKSQYRMNQRRRQCMADHDAIGSRRRWPRQDFLDAIAVARQIRLRAIGGQVVQDRRANGRNQSHMDTGVVGSAELAGQHFIYGNLLAP